MHRYRSRLENLMKFNQETCKVLPLGRNNPGHQHGLGADQLSREGLWAEHEPAMLTYGKESQLGCIRRAVDAISRGPFQPQSFCDPITTISISLGGRRAIFTAPSYGTLIALIALLDPFKPLNHAGHLGFFLSGISHTPRSTT